MKPHPDSPAALSGQAPAAAVTSVSAAAAAAVDSGAAAANHGIPAPGSGPAPSAGAHQILGLLHRAQQLLMEHRNSAGWWTGRLSTSALSTATAVLAQLLALQHTSSVDVQERLRRRVRGGLAWLAAHRNPDGGWGDTVLSFSNISTTMLSHAVFHAASNRIPGEFESGWREVSAAAQAYIERAGGVDAVIRRYGRDRTFSVPILTHCALAGTVSWKRVIPLPFELACVPQRWYAAMKLPVVSYALPALIAIGQAVFVHRSPRNPLIRWIRRGAIPRSLRILESIQPVNGGFLEAAPLTSFVAMSLISCGQLEHPVVQRCLQFLESSVLEDGSWPIDTNLSTWLTTLSINALAGSADGLPEELDRQAIGTWLLNQQYRTVHPYTGAAPGGWSWTDLPGGVPDADDTPGAMLALLNLHRSADEIPPADQQALVAAGEWLLGLQNRDGGWPTFCRGWGALPFDRSSSDLTAHVLRAFQLWHERCGLPSARYRAAMQRGLRYLRKQQRSDGTWLPLWFGNQHHAQDENPLYGTTRVLRALAVTGRVGGEETHRAVEWLLSQQQADGSWSAARDLPASVEETSLALESLSDFVASSAPNRAVSFRSAAEMQAAAGLERVYSAGDRAFAWLLNRVAASTVDTPAPIGFYFAKLWYFESLYPVIFAVSGLNRWDAVRNRPGSATISGPA